MGEENLEEIGFVDWNKFDLDYMADYLEAKWWMHSSGEAKCIHELIKFYREHKDK